MPEKSPNEVSRNHKEMFDKGNVAFQRNNLDYAIDIFTKVLEAEPGFYKCREALRAAQFKKMGANTGFFKRVLGTASASPALAKGQLALRSNPLDALNIAEQILNSDPNNTSAHKLLAEAAIQSDFPRTAILSLEIVFKASPKDRKVGLQLGEALLNSNQSARAETIFREILRQYPDDPEILQMLKNVSAQQTMSEQGYGQIATGNASYRDMLRNKEEAELLEQEKKVQNTDENMARVIYDFEMQLQQEPQNLRLARKIGDLYAQKKEYDRALEYYQYVRQSEQGVDSSLDKTITELQVKKINQQLDQLDPQDPESAGKREELLRQKGELQLEECKARVEKNPADLQLRFELGQAYFFAGKINEAIQELQRSKEHPNRKVQSLGLLGQCFAQRGILDMAARSLQSALAEKLSFDTEKKDLVYQYGMILEKMGKKAEAIDEFKKIYEVDISYKDVASRVESFYSQKNHG